MNFNMLKYIKKGTHKLAASLLVSVGISAVQGMEDPSIVGLNDYPQDIHHAIMSSTHRHAMEDFDGLRASCTYWRDLFAEKLPHRVILLGTSGSGKSTLAHLMFNDSLFSNLTDRGFHALDTHDELANIHIGHGYSAGTLNATSCIDFINKRVIWDCPGFNDPRGPDQNYRNAKNLYNLLKGNVRIILVGADYNLKNESFALSVNRITEIFPETTQLEKLFSFVITQYGSSLRFNKNPNKDNMKPILNRLPCLSAKSKNLLINTLDKQLQWGIFPAPTDEGVYTDSPELLQFLSHGNYVTNPTVTAPIESSVKFSQNLWCSPHMYYR